MRGGHSRVGPLPLDGATRRLHGGKRRARAAAVTTARARCARPADLTPDERRVWDYYARELAAVGRLTKAARGVLQAYCTTLATVGRLRRQLAAAGHQDVTAAGQKSPVLGELRHWLNLARLLESDLLLSPAAALRAPAPAPPTDPFAEFDKPETWRSRPAHPAATRVNGGSDDE